MPRARSASYRPTFPSFSHSHCLTLQSEWHRDRSLATWRWWGRQQRLESLHVRRYIVVPLSVYLDTLRARNLLAATTVHFTTHRSAKKRSTTLAPNFSVCKAVETLLPHANVVCHFLRHRGFTALAPSGITIARSSHIVELQKILWTINELQDNLTPFWTGIVARSIWLHAVLLSPTFVISCFWC